MNRYIQTLEHLRRSRPLRLFAWATVLALFCLAAAPQMSAAQESPGQPADQVQPTQPAESERLSTPQLEQLLAPIALYPDSLLTQILMACTYPLEVVEAYRWVSDPNNAALKGQALEAALEVRDWDPSVKSLVPFPDILKTMNDKLGWMQQLGNAFLSQQADVMEAVQELRAKAAAAGNLQSNDQQKVVTEGQTIVIQPVSPEIVYVPYYNPMVVYGTWLWPAYPPVYFGPWSGYAIHVGYFSWFSFGTIGLFWGWSSFDWHHHDIYINRRHYNRIISYTHRPSYLRNTWVHNPYHRRGVPYRSPELRARFRPNPSGTPASRFNYRGYQPGARTLSRPPARRATPEVKRTQPGTQQQERRTYQQQERRTYEERTRSQIQSAPARPAQPSTRTQPQIRTVPARPAQPSTRTQSQFRTAPNQAARQIQRAQQMKAPPVITVPKAPQMPPAYQNYTSGAAARAAAQRARASRQTRPAPSSQVQPRRSLRPRNNNSNNRQNHGPRRPP